MMYVPKGVSAARLLHPSPTTPECLYFVDEFFYAPECESRGVRWG